jgi:hypothetical protein
MFLFCFTAIFLYFAHHLVFLSTEHPDRSEVGSVSIFRWRTDEEIPVLLPPLAELVSCPGGPDAFRQSRAVQESDGLNVVSQLANSFPFLLSCLYATSSKHI